MATDTTDRTHHVTPGFGPMLLEQLGYSQAVRLGDRVEISGQGGWDDELRFPASIAEEIARAFDNVERTLAEAGASWQDVYSVESFHLPTEADAPGVIGTETTRLMTEQLKARMGERAPIWTQIGVAALGAPGMRVEVRVSAQVAGASTVAG